MELKRRSFIASLLATAVIDPERLLWVPGRKKIFVPPVPMNPLADADWAICKNDFIGYVIYNGETGRIIASGNVDDSNHIGEGRYRVSLSASQLDV